MKLRATNFVFIKGKYLQNTHPKSTHEILKQKNFKLFIWREDPNYYTENSKKQPS